MRRLFIVVCALLLYGSLYPWQFNFWGPLLPAVIHVFHSWPGALNIYILKDNALNVAVYIPLGLTAYLSSAAAGFRWGRALWPIAFGFLLSLSVETLQSFLPGRVPSSMDLLCNTIGSAAGVGVAVGYEAAIVRWMQRLNQRAMRPSSALMMLLVFAGHYLMPLAANAIRLFSIYHRPSLPQQWIWEEFTNSVVGWLLASRFAEVVAGKSGNPLPVIAAGLLLAGGTLLISHDLLFTIPMAAGALAGVVIWKIIQGRALAIPLALLTLVWLIGDGLRPFAFTDHKAFDWIPFRGLLGNDWIGGVTSLLTKTWMYGSAFWTWERAGLSRRWALAALLAVLGAIEFAQMYLPGRTSTMTDLAMGAIAAGLLWSVERKYGN